MTRIHKAARLALVLALAPTWAIAVDSTVDPHVQHAGQDAGEIHDHHARPDEAADKLPTQRWLPDAPLSSGMRRVRALTATLEHGGHGHLDDAQVRAIAAELTSTVEMMFAKCQLEPAPDAALHPLLARVLAASNRLAEVGFDEAALAELQAVIARYPLVFDDTGWSVTPGS